MRTSERLFLCKKRFEQEMVIIAAEILVFACNVLMCSCALAISSPRVYARFII